MKQPLYIFTELGERLATFGEDAASRAVIERAETENGWFTEADMRYAVRAICEDMLCREKLEPWLSSYGLPEAAPAEPKHVAIIMAGNIPLVGFFDLLCVVASGNNALVKVSGKDRILMEYIVDLLRDIEPEIPIVEFADQMVDAVIATGSDNANRYFRSRFANIPSLLRGNRHSVAVLTGGESPEQMELLSEDIYRYSGLGCRNVSLIFAPEGLEIRLAKREVCPKYENNLRQTRALLEMGGVPYAQSGCSLLVEGEAFSAQLSRINVVRYDSLAQVEAWLLSHEEELQCVVSDAIEHSRRVDFGSAQRPALTDYPDQRDVMRFLLDLE
ncbi:MAG: aldehyde dehydrogenase [Alistipes sp.]|nr:aldehyde dehydrogenase [Alistipes sp.]